MLELGDTVRLNRESKGMQPVQQGENENDPNRKPCYFRPWHYVENPSVGIKWPMNIMPIPTESDHVPPGTVTIVDIVQLGEMLGLAQRLRYADMASKLHTRIGWHLIKMRAPKYVVDRDMIILPYAGTRHSWMQYMTPKKFTMRQKVVLRQMTKDWRNNRSNPQWRESSFEEWNAEYPRYKEEWTREEMDASATLEEGEIEEEAEMERMAAEDSEQRTVSTIHTTVGMISMTILIINKDLSTLAVGLFKSLNDGQIELLAEEGQEPAVCRFQMSGARKAGLESLRVIADPKEMQAQREDGEADDEQEKGKGKMIRTFAVFKDGSESRCMVQFSRWDVNRHQDMLRFAHEVVKRWGMGSNPIAAGPEIHEIMVQRRDNEGWPERNKYYQLKKYVNIRLRMYVPAAAVHGVVCSGCG